LTAVEGWPVTIGGVEYDLRKAHTMLQTTKRTIAAMTAAACLGSAGWAIAGTSNSSSNATGQTTATQSAIAASSTTPPRGQPPRQTQVTGDAAAKITAAVLAKVPGAAIDRVEQDPQGYHAHITKSDGTRATARVNAQFEVTAVEAGGPGGPGGPGRGGPGGPGGQRPDETLLTGDNAAKAKAAALAKLPGSTVVKVETDADGGVYEAHVTKSDGSPATVVFDKDFTVTAVQSH
jgi:uncharacterized membrane protein YkoI